MVQPLTLLYIIFDGKGTRLVYLLLTNGTPFTNLEFRTLHPFNLLQMQSLKYGYMILKKTGLSLDFFTVLKRIC